MSETDKSPSSLRFTTRHLFFAMVLIAIPLALFQAYWYKANETVDQRTIPFAEIAAPHQAYLYSAVLSLILGVACVAVWLFIRRKRKTAILFVFVIALFFFVSSPVVMSKIFRPVRGNPIAKTHNDAACIVAMATIKFVDRNARWPGSWTDLEEDLLKVLDELNDSYAQRKGNPDPFAMASPDDSYWGKEASQSIAARAPDVSELTLSTIPKLVEIDFGADPKVLASQKWFEFQGIIPRKPSYNLYRVEFQKLIERLSHQAADNH